MPVKFKTPAPVWHLLFCRVHAVVHMRKRGGLSAGHPTTFCFLPQVLVLFETKHQFKQRAVIAEAVGPPKGPQAAGAPPVT